MYKMPTSDFWALNKSVLALNRDDLAETFAERLAGALSTLVNSELAAVECFDRTAVWTGRLLGDPEGLVERYFPAFLRLGRTHPLFPSFLAGRLGREPVCLSDVTGQTSLRGSAIYAEFLRPLGVEYQMGVSVHLEDGSAEVLILSRSGVDFSPCERERLRAFLPHLRLSRRRLAARITQCKRVREDLSWMQREPGLTKRETDIVWWLARGKADKDIAEICGISERTVQKHCENIYRKLGVDGRIAAVVMALDRT